MERTNDTAGPTDTGNADRNGGEEEEDAGDVDDVRTKQRCCNIGTLGYFARGCRMKGLGKGKGMAETRNSKGKGQVGKEGGGKKGGCRQGWPYQGQCYGMCKEYTSYYRKLATETL